MTIYFRKFTRVAAFLISFSVLLLSSCNPGNQRLENAKSEDVWLNVSRDYGEFSLTGKVVDETGMPLKDVVVVLCSSVCRPVLTDERGRYNFREIKSGFYLLDFRGDDVLPYRRTSVIFPINISKKIEKLMPVVLLPVTSGIRTDDGLGVDIAGLKLMSDKRANLQMLDGTKIPAEYWPSYQLENGGRKYFPLAMWALSPFGENGLKNLFLKGAYIEGKWSGDVGFFLVNIETGSCDWIGNAIMTEGLVTNKKLPLNTLSWIVLAKQD